MTEAAAAPRRAAMGFVLVTVFLDVIGMGLVMPVWPQLVKGFLGGDTVKASAALGVFSTVYMLMQFFCSPLLGSISDRFGRRPVILISVFGMGLDYIVMALSPSLGWLFIGRIASGAAAATFSTAYAYIADVTPAQKRAGAFGLVSAAFGIGYIAGPLLGGLLGQVSPRLPFWAAAGLALASGLYGLFVLPESLPSDRRGKFSLARANPLGALVLLRRHRELIGLASVNFLTQLANCVFNSVWVLYVIQRYGWSSMWVGASLAMAGLSVACIQTFLTRRVVAGLGERRGLMLGLVLGGTGQCLCGLAAHGWLFLASIPILCLWGFAGPCAQALMSHRVGADEQGRLQGANSSVSGLAGLIGPGLFSAVFTLALAQHDNAISGAPFILAGLLLYGAMITAWFVTRTPGPAP
jgi:DHA1 family tetracycline resistance protein-like MFS transporter